MRVFSNRPDVLLELVRQIFENKQNKPLKMFDLMFDLNMGVQHLTTNRYKFVEKNWHRSIGKAINTLNELGYNILHEKRSYIYIPTSDKNYYTVVRAIRDKQLLKFSYCQESTYQELEKIEKIAEIIQKKLPNEEFKKEIYKVEHETDVIVSPYSINNGKLLCGKKSGKDSEKTYDFFVYELSRMRNIRIEKTSNNSRYYSFEKACAKLPKTFFIDTEDDASEQILRKNIALYKTYEIGYYEKNLFEELSKKFTDVVNIERKNAKKYYTQFTHFDEDDVFNYIRQINTENRNIRFKKEQQKRYEEWLEKQKKD